MDAFTQPLILGEFFPLYLLSTWKEPKTLTPTTTFALALSSGVENGGFPSRVALNGMALELVVKCPKPQVDLDMMHEKWLMNPTVRFEKYHPKYTGFSEKMKSFRVRSFDWIESKALINLPFCVQSFILLKRNMPWRDDSTRMVYIRLKAADEQYAILMSRKVLRVFK